MKHLIKLSRRIVILAVVLAAMAPAIVTPSLIFPFVTGKSLFFEIVVAVAFPFWVTLLFFDLSSRPARHPLSIAITAQTTVAFLAGIFGVDFLQSFWGRDERMVGIITRFILQNMVGHITPGIDYG